MRAAFPAGLGQDSVEQTGGVVREVGGAILSERPPEAVCPEQLGGGATTAAQTQDVVRFRASSGQIHSGHWTRASSCSQPLDFSKMTTVQPEDSV